MVKEYVAWFIPQEQGARAFVDAFQRETEALLHVAGEQGVNKHWLIQRLRHECSVLNIPYAYLNFGDDHSWDYLVIVRQTRDQMGAAHFNLLTRALNKIGTGILPSLDEVDHLHRQDTRAAEGRSAVEKDDYAFVRARRERDQKALEERVTLAFYTCLKALSEKRPVVFMFDSYQKGTEAADRWIRANLLAWTCEERLPRLITLTAGEGEPSLASPTRARMPDSAWCGRLVPTNTFARNMAPLTEYVWLSELRQPPSGRERGGGQTDEKGAS
jgi:hypothetical protein